MAAPTSTMLLLALTTIYKSAETVVSLTVRATPWRGISRPSRRDHCSPLCAIRITPGICKAVLITMVESTLRATRTTPTGCDAIAIKALLLQYPLGETYQSKCPAALRHQDSDKPPSTLKT